MALTLASAAAIVGLALPIAVNARPAARAHRSVPIVHPAFRPLGVATVLIDGPHVLLGDNTLLNEATGAKTAITPPAGCAPLAIGGPWIAAECGIPNYTPPYLPQPELYSIATGAWSAVLLAPSSAASCMINQDCQIRSVGRDSLAIFGGLCNHCSGHTLFQSLIAGEVRSDPTGPTTLPDLNSPSLAAHVCSPLRLPTGTVLDAGTVSAALGTLNFAGRFALATSDSADGPSTTYLEHCGSALHTLVCHCDPGYFGSFRTIAANSHVVIWATRNSLGTASPQLDGLYLPSRRRFKIPLPPALVNNGPDYLQLSTRTLYVTNTGGDNVFSARAPLSAPARASRARA